MSFGGCYYDGLTRGKKPKAPMSALVDDTAADETETLGDEGEAEAEDNNNNEDGLVKQVAVRPKPKNKLTKMPDGSMEVTRIDHAPKGIDCLYARRSTGKHDFTHRAYCCDLVPPDSCFASNGEQRLSSAVFDRSLKHVAVPCPVSKIHTPRHDLSEPIEISWTSAQAPAGEALNPRSLFNSMFPRTSDGGLGEYIQQHDLRHYLDDIEVYGVKYIIPYAITAQTHYGPDKAAEFVIDVSTPKSGVSSSVSSLTATDGSFSSSASSASGVFGAGGDAKRRADEAERKKKYINWINNKQATTVYQAKKGMQAGQWGQPRDSDRKTHSFPYVDCDAGEQLLFMIDEDGEMAGKADFSRWMAIQPNRMLQDIELMLKTPANRAASRDFGRRRGHEVPLKVVYPAVSDDVNSLNLAVWFWIAHGRGQFIKALDESELKDTDSIKADLFKDHANAADQADGVHRMLIFSEFLQYAVGQFFQTYDPNFHVMPVGPIHLRMRTQNPAQAAYLYDRSQQQTSKEDLCAFRITIKIYFDILPTLIRDVELDSKDLYTMVDWSNTNPLPAAP
jgi:hypothetical protein